ncbi:hypothetical protein V8C86DRAFT_620073 [Haematococcus lacustris]
MLGFFSPHSSHAHGHAKEQKEREEFTRVLIQDSEDVMGKVMATAHSEAKQVLKESVKQCVEFWSHQCHKQEELHRAALAALQAQLASANEQLSETVSSYNQVVKDLHRQVAEAQEANEAMQRMLEAKAAVVQHQAQSADQQQEEITQSFKALIQDLNRELAASHAAVREAEAKGQQKRQGRWPPNSGSWRSSSSACTRLCLGQRLRSSRWCSWS